MTSVDITSKHVKRVNTDALQAAMDSREEEKKDAEKNLMQDDAQGAASDKPVTTLSSCVDYTDIQDDELYYVGTAGVKVTELDEVETLHNLKKLHVRSNLLRSMSHVASLVQLEHLELYDNQIQAIDGVQELVHLKVLDLSFNAIRVIPNLSHLHQLEELYVANNKLKKIAGIANLPKLRKLDLGANRLRVIEGLDGLVELRELWLGKNKITAIEGLETLTKLKILSVQSNRLETITRLTNNIELEELYLSHNGIEKIENIDHLTNLVALDLAGNRIAAIPANLAPLSPLADLWLNDNHIAHYADVENLMPLVGLRTLYLERNPLALDFEYRKKLEELLPQLDQIDATPARKKVGLV
ncbi:hypothetical protein PsorP6_005136 [Peronosclerospora sorghi]|uniref:Uncharacterized protein n=1 Tax=Peronosclerospora sorghi TaxID=230839 RepID=A0ACC0W5K3_9STRA|nr:hypothetical protein PsorP6_005136 [Peronosclerospora sorghi]